LRIERNMVESAVKVPEEEAGVSQNPGGESRSIASEKTEEKGLLCGQDGRLWLT